uniref:Uncharacterized protein n=1 Tax=Ciona savignyi TaxID=51511 RepID=H2Z199_CIOSA
MSGEIRQLRSRPNRKRNGQKEPVSSLLPTGKSNIRSWLNTSNHEKEPEVILTRLSAASEKSSSHRKVQKTAPTKKKPSKKSQISAVKDEEITVQSSKEGNGICRVESIKPKTLHCVSNNRIGSDTSTPGSAESCSRVQDVCQTPKEDLFGFEKFLTNTQQQFPKLSDVDLGSPILKSRKSSGRNSVRRKSLRIKEVNDKKENSKRTSSQLVRPAPRIEQKQPCWKSPKTHRKRLSECNVNLFGQVDSPDLSTQQQESNAHEITSEPVEVI